ncbi:ubiquitin-associated- domain-containing protein [Desulforamulus reducens MI-1]|uniref:Ubiquitin-associated-domain-containing protein n=1 Tax=Desulforamulus reducens (strain ATCC BAA-1160 / DSM 100696 / MI-1) TaxID=349161 RepID=A4J4R2_DESRM|nr:DUF4342 domain-containing protein [Desulforamulus reducens]ABO50065.1 ubiquitin-associated- domain-containing protein [Desulforamulus reducens MI-1]
MTFNLELVDELKKRTNVSYADAKDALEQCNGNLLEALVYLEKHNKINDPSEEKSFLNRMKKLLKKGNNTRFIVCKKERTILDLSVTVTLIITVCAPYIVMPVLLLGLVTGHRMKFEGKNGEELKVNKTLHKLSDAVDTAKKKLSEDDTVTQ